MNREIVFSIIVPTYNRANLISETIKSVLEQTYFNFELIIVDDGSTDNTEEIVRCFLQDERVKYYKINNGERGAARNFGVKRSNGDYVTFLDSDDVFLPWHLHTVIDKIALADSPEVFHLAYEILYLNTKVQLLPSLPSPVNDKLIEGNFLSCMGVFLRRDIALTYRFDEDRQLSGSEDIELWLRIASSVPILTFQEITSRLINHDARSVTNSNNEKLTTRFKLLEYKLGNDQRFLRRFGNRLDVFKSYNSLYLALHLTLMGDRLLGLKSLLFAARQSPKVMMTYRFGVAFKKIILG